MRVAVLSDIHGNLTAFEAVLADLHLAAPDLILHGGDLADGGSNPAAIVDHIRSLGWRGVMGNADEMLVDPSTLEAFVAQSSAPAALWDAVRENASATRAALGDERLAWLHTLPYRIDEPEFALLHASPANCWRAPAANATGAELEEIYAPVASPIVIFGHTHVPAVRKLPGTSKLLVNAGSVGLPYDGDPRAAYLLLDEGVPAIRRVTYDVKRELRALAGCGLPGAAWTAKMLRASAPQMP